MLKTAQLTQQREELGLLSGTSPHVRSRCDRAAYAPVERVAVDAQLMQHLDRIHALLGDGFAPPESLSSYLDFLDSMPHGVSISPKLTVAVALIDNVLAIDELKLEQRRLRCALDALETATYELLVRIGRKHAEIIGQSNL